MVFYVQYILNVETDTSSRYSYLCFYSLYDLVNIHLFHDASNIVAMQRVSIKLSKIGKGAGCDWLPMVSNELPFYSVYYSRCSGLS